MSEHRPLISICTITYNHENYIEKAILSVLEQRHNYKVEFVIGDDCSTDKTREIIRKYATQFPDLFVTLFPEKNQGSMQNTVHCLRQCKGKYIAFLEGDDYWTDPYKLEKQVSFMEAHPEFSTCFSDVDIIDEIGMAQPNPFLVPGKEDLGIDDIIMAEKVFIPTPTLFFKNELPDPFPKYFTEAISGDIAIHLLMADQGRVKYMPIKTAIYRQHSGGITKSAHHIAQSYKELFNMYVKANEHYDFKYDEVFRKRLADMSKTLLIYFSREKTGVDRFTYIIRNSANYFRYAPRLNAKEITYYFLVLFFPSVLKLKKKN